MTNEHTPTLQQIAADRDWWSADAGRHYRELAHWLRGIAAKCRLPYTQKELLDLAGDMTPEPIASIADLLSDDR
jgi:hypothetical protein